MGEFVKGLVVVWLEYVFGVIIYVFIVLVISEMLFVNMEVYLENMVSVFLVGEYVIVVDIVMYLYIVYVFEGGILLFKFFFINVWINVVESLDNFVLMLVFDIVLVCNISLYS